MWMMWCVKVHSHVLPIKTVEPVVKARVTNISFLLTISIDIQEKKSWQLIDSVEKGQMFVFLFSQPLVFFKEMYGDQSGEKTNFDLLKFILGYVIGQN